MEVFICENVSHTIPLNVHVLAFAKYVPVNLMCKQKSVSSTYRVAWTSQSPSESQLHEMTVVICALGFVKCHNYLSKSET